MIFIYAIIIVAFLDTFLQLPIISTYAHSVGAGNLLTGMIIAVYSLANMGGNIIAGHWIDQFGRRRVLFFGMAFAAVILLFYPLAETGWQLFFIRFFHGLAGGALIPAAFAYLGDLAPENRRGKMMAFSGACIGTAAIIGPAAGGIISARISPDAVFYIASIIFVITCLAVLFLLKESAPASARRNVSLSHFRRLAFNPFMVQASLSALTLTLSMGVLTFALPLRTEELGLSPSVTGLLLSSFGIIALFIFLTPANRLYDKFRPQSIIIAGLILIGLSLFSLSVVENIYLITAVMLVYGTGFSFVFPSMNRIIVEISGTSDRGKAFGVFYASYSLGIVAGSFFAGAAADFFGYPFRVSGGLVLAMSLTLFWLVKKQSGSAKTRESAGVRDS
ncbi:MFS transporter [Evansella clarkii]|uniref:MFS transporter n=1 Tax=Evansella clarkii TaxID=79879 RepID=UPI00099850A6|nr:MFS transporter [Evansella clarkii]